MNKSLLAACLSAVMAAAIPTLASAKDTFTIGLSNGWVGSEWRTQMIDEAEQAAKEWAKRGITVKTIAQSSNVDVPGQIAHVRNFMNQGVDAIIVNPNSPTAFDPIFAQAKAKGILVISTDAEVSSKDAIYVGIDQKGWAMQSADWLAKTLKGKGDVVAINGVAGHPANQMRVAGYREVFAKYPGIEILDHQYCDWSPPKAKSIMEAMIQAFPRIDGIWADSGLMSWPALQALQEAKRPLVPSTGDQLNGYTKFLVANKVRGYACPMTTKLSGEAVKQALAAVKGEKVEKKLVLTFPGYGPDEIQKLSKPDLSDWWWIGDDQMPAEFLPKVD